MYRYRILLFFFLYFLPSCSQERASTRSAGAPENEKASPSELKVDSLKLSLLASTVEMEVDSQQDDELVKQGYYKIKSLRNLPPRAKADALDSLAAYQIYTYSDKALESGWTWLRVVGITLVDPPAESLALVSEPYGMAFIETLEVSSQSPISGLNPLAPSSQSTELIPYTCPSDSTLVDTTTSSIENTTSTTEPATTSTMETATTSTIELATTSTFVAATSTAEIPTTTILPVITQTSLTPARCTSLSPSDSSVIFLG